jgi:hypothetical protein
MLVERFKAVPAAGRGYADTRNGWLYDELTRNVLSSQPVVAISLHMPFDSRFPSKLQDSSKHELNNGLAQ